MRDRLKEQFDHDARVQDQDLHHPGLTESMDAVWTAAKAETGGSMAPRASRPRARRRIAAAVVTVVVVGVGAGGAPAFAEWVGLRTGEYETGSLFHPKPKTPDREYWRMDSPELVPHLRAWEQEYPLAPGYTLDPLITSYATNFKNSEMPAAGFRTDVFLYSECTWVDAWLTADRARNTTAKTKATEGLAATVAKLDTPVRIGLDPGGRAFLIDLVAAAQQDNPAPLKREHRLNCGWKFR